MSQTSDHFQPRPCNLNTDYARYFWTSKVSCPAPAIRPLSTRPTPWAFATSQRLVQVNRPMLHWQLGDTQWGGHHCISGRTFASNTPTMTGPFAEGSGLTCPSSSLTPRVLLGCSGHGSPPPAPHPLLCDGHGHRCGTPGLSSSRTSGCVGGTRGVSLSPAPCSCPRPLCRDGSACMMRHL